MNNHVYKTVRTVLAGLALISGTGHLSAQFNWGPAGPIFTAGRARNMVVDKNNPNTLYVGSSSSGVFKSTTGGAEWAPLDDQAAVKNISYMAQSADGTIYVGTGEGFLRYGQKAKAQVGTGLYTVSGNSLLQVATSTVVGTVINRIACHPTNPKIIALATNLGVLITSNGKDFSPITAITHSPVADLNYGMDVKFSSAGILYFTIGNERGHHPYGAVMSQVYKSTNANLNSFDSITPVSASLQNSVYGRIELGISPSDPNVIYASCANKNTSTAQTDVSNSASLKAMYVSTDGGITWSMFLHGAPHLDPLSNGGSIATGDYAHVLQVSHNDPYKLLVGGYRAYLYDASAAEPTLGTWSQLGNIFAVNTPAYLHENIHDIKIIPGSPDKYFFITDAGIYRSLDMITKLLTQFQQPSFQAWYKGLVTGQLNSVSIARFPPVSGKNTESKGQAINPNFAYIAGTGGNGLVYYSGTSSLVTQESSYLGGGVYESQFSKLLPNAAIFSGSSNLYRITDVKSAQPALLNVNRFTGGLSVISPSAVAFVNPNTTTGTSFDLWENYGQVKPSPDSVFFYNDSLTAYATIGTFTALTTQTTFTFMPIRPDKFARLDSIALRTGTVELPINPSKIPQAFTTADKKDILINLTDQPVPTTTIEVTTPAGPQIQNVQVFKGADIAVMGPADTVTNKPVITLNNSTLIDNISVSFTAPPFANKNSTLTGVPNPALYYRVSATLFYSYKVGDTVRVVDDNISTMSHTHTIILKENLNWAYGDSASRAPVDGLVPFPKNNPLVGVPSLRSARLAIGLNSSPIIGDRGAIVVAKAPLNLNDPLNYVRVAQSGAYTDDASGNPTTNRIYYSSAPTLVKWSPTGTELYFAGNDNKLYRVSHITRIMDMSESSEKGKFNTDVYRYGTGITTASVNPNSPYRTTLIGQFDRQITSLSISNDGASMVVTLDGAGTGTTAPVLYNTTDIRKADQTTQVWIDKAGTSTLLKGKPTYCSLIEMSNNKKVLIGTDEGLVYTSDITTTPANWVSANNNMLPRVQVFDIDQQTMNNTDSYNSGEIYVATNGRGVWSSRSLFVPYVVSVEEQEMTMTRTNNLTIFPNPAVDKVNIAFTSVAGENAVMQVMDLSGRLIYSEPLGKLGDGNYVRSFDTRSIGSGIYIVNVSSDAGIQRVSKLVINK